MSVEIFFVPLSESRYGHTREEFTEANIITEFGDPKAQTWIVLRRTSQSYYLVDENGVEHEFSKARVESRFYLTTSNSEREKLARDSEKME